MKKKLFGLALSLGLVFSSIGFALVKNNQPVSETQAADYYASVTDSMTGTTLLNQLNSIIDNNSVSVSYDWSRYEDADEDPNNSSNVILVYARNSVSKSAHVSGNTGWNREHTFPASKLENTQAEKDNHIIFASDNKVNGARSNIKMGVVTGGTVVNDYNGNPTTCRKTTSLFDPNNVARGIVARSTMYAAAMYGYDPTDNFESIATMLTWHLNYPVTSFDQGRNEKVYNNQHNRNPFVDHPEYACKIWGDTNSTTRTICGMSSTGITSISKTSVSLTVDETTTISAVSSNSGTISWSSSNTNVATVSSATAASGSNVTITAVGEGTATITASITISGTPYSKVCDVTVTSSSQQQTDSETITMSEKGFSDQQTVSTVSGTSSTVTFAKGSGFNDPKYYTSGSAVRAYSGNTITISSSQKIVGITFTFGNSDGSNTITSNVGTFSSPNWTGNANSVTFTIGGSSGNRRISAISITYESSGSVTPTSITASVNKTYYVGETISKSDITVEDNLGNTIIDFIFSDNNYIFVYSDALSGGALTNKTFTNSISYNSLTCSLTVQVQRKGRIDTASQDYSVTYTDLPTSYQTSTTELTAASGVKFVAYNLANYSSKMQFKASGGYFQTTQAMNLKSLTIVNRESNTLTVYGSNTAGSFSTTISGTNDVYNLTGYSYVKVARTSSNAAYCASLTISVGAADTATNLANYIMYEDTNNQCTTKFVTAKGYFEGLSSSERSTFMTSSDYVISTARERLQAWAANQGKTISYSGGDYIVSGMRNTGFSLVQNNNGVVFTVIIVSVLTITSLGGYFLLRKRKEQ